MSKEDLELDDDDFIADDVEEIEEECLHRQQKPI